MDKKTLRKIYLARRKELSSEEISRMSLQILSQLEKLPIWDKNCYHIFLPIRRLNELDTYPIIDRLFASGKPTAVPRSDFSKLSMKSCLLTRETILRSNAYGISEPFGAEEVDPLSIDVVFAPLLVFDRVGHRVGYGKGFYDRFLAVCRADVLKIGLSLFNPVDRILDKHPDDIPLDVAVTPKRVYLFRDL